MQLRVFLREFARGLVWAWRRARGVYPTRLGPADHVFAIRVSGGSTGSLTFSGACTKEEAHRLLGFLAVHEEPLVGVHVAEGCLLAADAGTALRGAVTVTGVAGDFTYGKRSS